MLRIALFLLLALADIQLWAASVDATQKFSWSENSGWLNHNSTHGTAHIYADHLEGFVWSESVGWIKLGSYSGGGSHTYINSSSNNWGVNHDGAGKLSGYAWSENAGWINFNPSHSQVVINLATGDFDGYAWSESLGWIHFYGPNYKVTVTNYTGDSVLKDDIARSYGVDGEGQKVCVIADGIDHHLVPQQANDLPHITVASNTLSGDEGTAILEIIHRVAPAASLVFSDYGSSPTETANRITMLASNYGCDVLLHDVLWSQEPAFEDGPIAQAVESAISNYDVVYVAASGDQQQRYYRGSFSDPNNNTWHNFVTSSEFNRFTLPANETIKVHLQWDNEWGNASDDYDFYLLDDSSNVLDASEILQNGDDDPFEEVVYTNTSGAAKTVSLTIKKYSGEARELFIHINGTPTDLTYHGSKGSIYGHAAAESAIAVGAIHSTDENYDDISSSSSQGDVYMREYNLSGRPVSSTTRKKPNLVAIDVVETKVGQAGYYQNPYTGTSAAAAHVAGIAALVRQAYTNLNAAQVKAILQNSAVDLGSAGLDSVFGYGRVNAQAAVDLAFEGNPDDDYDGMPDTWENENNLNRLSGSDASRDLDMDGLSNLDEYKQGTDPNESDSDGDGFSDKVELDAGTNPIDSNDYPRAAWRAVIPYILNQ